jgi:hypothetical protein
VIQSLYEVFSLWSSELACKSDTELGFPGNPAACVGMAASCNENRAHCISLGIVLSRVDNLQSRNILET